MSISREGKICSFCGTPGGPGTDLLLLGGLGAQVCATCIDDFHSIVHDRDKVAEYHELYRRLGTYPYDQDPLRPGWTPLVPNTRWADPRDARRPEIPF